MTQRLISLAVIGEEGVLRPCVQRRPRRPAVGLQAPELRGNAHHHGLHQDPAQVLQGQVRANGGAGGAAAGVMEG